MSEQTVSWRTKQISSVCRELKQELHDIVKCVRTNEKLKKFNIKFTNRAKPQPVKVKQIHEQH